MKRLWVALFLCAGSLLSAQDRSAVRLYVAPVTGGTRQDREFFDANIPRELSSPRHIVVDSREAADFLVSLSIVRNEDPAHSSTLILGLSAASAASDSPLLELFWNYQEPQELYTWGLGAILSSGMTGDSGNSQDSGAVRDSGEPDNWRRRTPRFYLGLRAGPSFAGHYFQASPDYYAGYGGGMGVEGGLTAELRLLRFLSIQAEGEVVYEAFDGPVAEGNLASTDTFTSLTLVVPVLVKAPLSFGRFVLSLYAGAYYTLALGETGGKTVTMETPFGFTAGTELSFPLGPGALFGDLRYGRDLGATAIGEDGPRHIRDRSGVSLGYKFGF